MDAGLITRARAGDRAALAQLLEQLSPLVYRFGLRMCRHRADAEDVLQDTLLSVADHLAEFEGRASLSSWVFMLARTACARKRRGLKNRSHLPEEAVAELASEAGSPEQSALQGELRLALERALGGLSSEQREVLLLRDMEGLSAPEVAEALGMSVPAVKSRLHRARISLREALRSGEQRPPSPGCPDVLGALSRKLEGELAAQDCAAMERHVEQCPACAAACAELRSALQVCRAQSDGPLPEAVQARVKAAVRLAVARAAP